MTYQGDDKNTYLSGFHDGSRRMAPRKVLSRGNSTPVYVSGHNKTVYMAGWHDGRNDVCHPDANGHANGSTYSGHVEA